MTENKYNEIQKRIDEMDSYMLPISEGILNEEFHIKHKKITENFKNNKKERLKKFINCEINEYKILR